MKNRSLHDKALQILRNPQTWKLVTFRFSDVKAVEASTHQRWMQQHLDVHPWQEFSITLQGHGYHGLCGRVYPCRPGYVFFFDSFEPHDFGLPPRGPAVTELWICISHDKMSPHIIERKADGRIMHTELSYDLTCEENLRAYRDINTVLHEKTDLPPQVVHKHLVATLSRLVTKIVEFGHRQPPDGRLSSVTEKIKAVCWYIRKTQGRGITLDQVAQFAGYSKYHFSRIFKLHVGQTVHQYINYCRMIYLEKLMVQQCPHKQIAAELGFSHRSTFGRWLHQVQQKHLAGKKH